jgi:hypothetical protein
MTVKQLKEELKGFQDDCEVMIALPGCLLNYDVTSVKGWVGNSVEISTDETPDIQCIHGMLGEYINAEINRGER